MGPQIPINLDKMSDHTDYFIASSVKEYTDAVLADPSAFLLRAAVFMNVTNTSFSNDVFDGFSYERDMLINGFVEKTNNPIVLGGDSHDSWS